MRDGNLGVASGCSSFDRPDDGIDDTPQAGPAGGKEHDDRDVPVAQVLLMLEVRVRCDEHVIPLTVGRREQVTVAQRRPAFVKSGRYLMPRERFSQGHGRTLIEEDAHSGGD